MRFRVPQAARARGTSAGGRGGCCCPCQAAAAGTGLTCCCCRRRWSLALGRRMPAEPTSAEQPAMASYASL